MSYIGNTNITQAFTPAVDFFSGNASTTAFTLSRPVASVAQVEAVISNVVQDPGSAYTVNGSTITFTSAPPSGTNNIYVRYTSPITQVIAPGQGTVNTTSLASSTGSGAVVLGTGPTITGAVMSSMASSVITSGTVQNSTSGTAIDFTGLPAWVKRVTVMLNSVSLSASAHILVQIGSGSFTTTGYTSSSGYCFSGNVASGTTSTSGFVIIDGNASQSVTGILTINLLTGNTWVSGHSASIVTAGGITGSGVVALSGTLDRVRITTTSTDTFDAGSINILYE